MYTDGSKCDNKVGYATVNGKKGILYENEVSGLCFNIYIRSNGEK